MIDLIGQQFGRLTVIEHAGKNKFGKVMWLCQCEDGNIVTVSSNVLRQGLCRSCGCITRGGWSDTDALTIPVGPSIKDRLVYLECDGQCLTLKAWAIKLGISYGILKDRHKKGWSTEAILTTPRLRMRRHKDVANTP